VDRYAAWWIATILAQDATPKTQERLSYASAPC
jgi:hypothetical protein